jgi:hypothetical protein
MKETQESVIRYSPLIEANRKLTKRVVEHQQDKMLESIRKTFGVDMGDSKKFALEDPFFSWTRFRESAYKLAESKMQEANAENTFGQLLRAGINLIANNWYNLVDTNHELVGATTFSNHAIELHAPLHRGAVPRRVQAGGKFPHTKVRGLDIQIANEKFGAISDFERELFDDDQTGQIAQRARDIGENMRILEDAWFFQRFLGTAGSYAGDPIPASQTYTTVWSTSLDGGGANKPSSYGAFSPANIQAGDIALMNQKDLLGNLMLVNPNTLIVSPSNKFAAMTLLNSQWYPTNATVKIGGGTGADSTVGTSFAANVMQGLYNLVVTRFWNAGNTAAKAWALGEGGKGIVFQRRDALEVIQENPMSGMAFTNDVFSFRSRSRFEPDWVDIRFWWLGNDGSI